MSDFDYMIFLGYNIFFASTIHRDISDALLPVIDQEDGRGEITVDQLMDFLVVVSHTM